MFREICGYSQGFEGITGQISYQDGSQIPSKSAGIIGIGEGKLQLIKQFVPKNSPAP